MTIEHLKEGNIKNQMSFGYGLSSFVIGFLLSIITAKYLHGFRNDVGYVRLITNLALILIIFIVIAYKKIKKKAINGDGQPPPFSKSAPIFLNTHYAHPYY